MDATELAAFLHSRRDRLKPADVGLAGGPRRRVPGLRREEVAFLANASIDYYIELERGRGVQPSAQMLLALARALRLTGDERDHLFHLAGHPTPPPREPSRGTDPSLLALLDRLDGTPARIMTDLLQPLAQNRLAAKLLGEIDPIGEPAYASSMVYRWFTDPSVRSHYPAEDHARHAQSFVADMRAVAARRALAGGDAEAEKLVADLLDRSEAFARLWAERDVAVRRFHRKRFVHPATGVIELDCHHLFTEDGTQRLLWLAPVEGTSAAAQLAKLVR
ncbi:helix-turn-helix domain-containing protein [Glycomyces sp. NPDC048151]|uniref:MmyB family transcriptional regulator n=1 Tax=Glycomyces sp. NPDC048151 TaxID=3364002 RepID=UPI00371FB927